MAQVDWYIEGAEVTNCNCDYACPCQFESLRPTYGDCRGFAAVRIDKGHFGDVTLDDLGEPSSTPGQDRSMRATASVRPSSMRRRMASNETLLLPSCTVARPTRGRPIGGSTRRCQAPSIPRFSNTSNLT